ncbi:three prime repair exonuclease 2-like [Battus philenor]|uniref:three prime repair exonuclease 2-like n=1 Tax=Battus philenor TaxID=42288 RepID=UPI0035CFFBBC
MSIATYVFFDIETTGLPCKEKNQTKITELTFVAASASEIQSTPLGSLPLVNKLSLLFNPKKKISSSAEKITKLSNYSLSHQPEFKDRINTINAFLKELPKPVCLVAHNGNRFDYKIFAAEYEDANAEFPPDILCVDSLSGFRKILTNDSNILKSRKQNKKTPIYTSSPNSSQNNIMTDDEDEWPELNVHNEEWREIDNLSLSLSNMSCSEKEIKCKDNNDTAKEKISYSLSNLYKRLLKKEPIDAHRAEADCLMLLECVIATKSSFLAWANDAVVPLHNIKPLQRQLGR